uniref:Uncharacterized protein n=1 Tax=Bursaphelenchus xylophilus TaxID=6326 RepID=A0A1I7S1J2_BURXY
MKVQSVLLLLVVFLCAFSADAQQNNEEPSFGRNIVKFFRDVRGKLIRIIDPGNKAFGGLKQQQQQQQQQQVPMEAGPPIPLEQMQPQQGVPCGRPNRCQKK